jgi:hypothetical protein
MRATAAGCALAVAVAIGGCTTDSAQETAMTDAGGGLAETPGDGPSVDPARVARDERQVIHEAELTLRTRDVEDAAADAVRIVEDAGGYVDSQTADLEDSPHVTLVVKVPPSEYRTALAALEELGNVTNRTERTQDVTQQVVDIDARIGAAGTSTSRLRELLEGSGSLADIVELERELAAREAELESLVAIQGALRAQVDHATITLRIVRPAPAASGEPSDRIPGFLRGLEFGWGAFVNVVLGLVTAAGFALPFVVAGAVAAAGTRPLRRRWRRYTSARAVRRATEDVDDHGGWLVDDGDAP